MNSMQRKGVYGALLLLNALAAVCAHAEWFPTSWAHGLSMCSFLAAMLMKEYGAPDPTALAPAPDKNAS